MDRSRPYRREYSETKSPGKPPRSRNRRRSPGSWQPTVPAWEKKFCSSVCLISWKQLCETKELMSYYKNVAQWDDSAGEEAFQNAKARFWAEINGLPCDISLPNPDIYIDEIDWNSVIDPQLLLELDQEPPVPNDDEKDGLHNGWDSFFSDRPIPCSGWGDTEIPASPVIPLSAEPSWRICDRDPGDTHAQDCSAWGDKVVEENSWENARDMLAHKCNRTADHSNAWDWGGSENRAAWETSTGKLWGNCGGNAENNDMWGWNGWDNTATYDNSGVKGQGNSWGWGQWESNANNLDNLEPRKDRGSWNKNCRKREGGVRYDSRYKTSRSQGDYYQLNRGWRNCRERKTLEFPYEQPSAVDNCW